MRDAARLLQPFEQDGGELVGVDDAWRALQKRCGGPEKVKPLAKQQRNHLLVNFRPQRLNQNNDHEAREQRVE